MIKSLFARKAATAHQCRLPEATFLDRLLAGGGRYPIGVMTEGVAFEGVEWIVRYDDNGPTTIERSCGCLLDPTTGATISDCDD